MTTLALVRGYQQAFHTRPNITLALTGGSLNALGDIVAQSVENIAAFRAKEEQPKYDALRTLRFFSFGVVISPLLGRWNTFLEHRFPLRAIGSTGRRSLKALTKRVLCDQILFAPLGIATFFGGISIMEGRNGQQIAEKYRDLFVPTVLMNWKFWPALQFINFRFMPLPYRIPFQATCGVFWTLYLSLINSKEDEKQEIEAHLM